MLSLSVDDTQFSKLKDTGELEIKLRVNAVHLRINESTKIVRGLASPEEEQVTVKIEEIKAASDRTKGKTIRVILDR